MIKRIKLRIIELSLSKYFCNMLRTIVLVSPIFVTLFWSIALTGNEKNHNVSQLFLSTFMLFASTIFIALFLYLAPFPEIYPYFDGILQFAGSLALPIYYIYLRIINVDDKFTFKAHIRYLIVPFALAATYGVGAFMTPSNEYFAWLSDQNAFPESPNIKFLNTLRMVLLIHFFVQIFITVIGNQLLIHNNTIKAKQVTTVVEDRDYNPARMLNYSIIFLSSVLLVAFAIDREFLLPQDALLYLIWTTLSVMLYLMGYLGTKQKRYNSALELDMIQDVLIQLDIMPNGSHKKILNKMLVHFEEEKIYLNSQLNLMDIVNAVGTNRTYISSIINQQYNQNFCTFVNGYRIEELERVVAENPDYTNEILAECCGFGSLNTLKRAIFAKTGMSINEWKKQNISLKKLNC